MIANYSLCQTGQRCIILASYRNFAAASQSLSRHRPSSVHHTLSSRCSSPHLYRHERSPTIRKPSYALLLNYRGFFIRGFSTAPASSPPTCTQLILHFCLFGQTDEKVPIDSYVRGTLRNFLQELLQKMNIITVNISAA